MADYCIVTSKKPISDTQQFVITKNINYSKLVKLGQRGIELKIKDRKGLKALRRRFSSELDFNIVTELDRNKSLLLADMDGTILNEECIDELAFLIGRGEEVQQITRKAMTENLSFDWALRERLQMLKGTSMDVLISCLKEKINIRSGAKILFKTFNKLLGKTAIVSGGFTFFSEAISKEISSDFNYANVLEIKENKLTGNVIGSILNGEKKSEILKNLCMKMNIDQSRTLAIGDGNNDISMISMAGLGIAFNGSKALNKSAKIVLKNSDLSAILYLLGIREEQFVYR